MRVKISVVFFFLFPQMGWAYLPQNELYVAYQVDGSEAKMKTFMHGFPSSSQTSNMFYVIHIKPSTCPRCEGLINESIRYLRKKEPTCRIGMVIDFKRSVPAISYYHMRKFLADTFLVDTTSSLLSIINHSDFGSFLNVPFIYKIDISNGKMVSYLPYLGVSVDSSFIDKFQPAKRFESITVDKRDDSYEKIMADDSFTICLQSWVIPEDSTIAFSEPIFTNINADDQIVSFIDRFTKTVVSCDIKNKCVQAKIKPKLREYTILTDKNAIPLNQQLFYINNDILNVIYLGILCQKDSIVTVTSSLPMLKASVNDGDTIIDYVNVVSFVQKNFENRILRIDTLRNVQNQHGYYLAHANTVQIDSQLFIPLKRGWPIVGTDNLDLSDPYENPFDSDFYSTKYIYQVYDFPGRNFLKKIGSFESLYEKLRSGYSYIDPVITSDSNNLYLTDGRSGVVEKLDRYTFAVKDRVQLFEVNSEHAREFENKSQTLTDANEKLRYLVSIKKLLRKHILEIIVVGDNLNCVIKDDWTNEYFLIRKNIITKKHSTYKICTSHDLNIQEIYSLKLTKQADELILYTLFLSNGKYLLSKDVLKN